MYPQPLISKSKLIFGVLSIVVVATFYTGNNVTAQSVPIAPNEKLQFTSGDHVLQFDTKGFIMAAPTHVVKVDFVNAHTSTPKSNNPQSDLFSKVTYTNVWNGIDIVYEPSTTSIMKSTYYVDITKPNVTPNSIRLTYNRPVSLDTKGNLVITYDTGTITETAPIAWQVIDGVNVPVDVSFNILGTQEVGFTLGTYNPNYPLVIDPEYNWVSFLGGSGNDEVYSIALDSDNNIYVGGYSGATWGTPIRAYTNSNDGFVAKLNSSGTLLWHTFLGGSGSDSISMIYLDSDNNVYVGGSSSATWGSPIRTYILSDDGFLAKLSPSGTLLWNTFLGGSGTEYFNSLILDADSNVYVGGTSDATWGTPIRAYTSSTDGFVAKLNSSGTLLWNTFLGGSGGDSIISITLDSDSNIYARGDSGATWGTPIRAYIGNSEFSLAKLDSSGTLIWHTFLGGSGADYLTSPIFDFDSNIYIAGFSYATWGTPIRAYTSGADVVVVKLNSSGTLVWNTFLGGSGTDSSSLLTLDSDNNIYVLGRSNSTWGTPIRSYTSSYDSFITKLDSSGTLVWNTFLGGSGYDSASSITLDSDNNIYVDGYSDATWGTPIRAYTSSNDVFVFKIDSSGTLVWNTFLGGSGSDSVSSITLDSDNNIYVRGRSTATWGTPIRAYTASNDAFLAKLSPSGSLINLYSVTPTAGANGSISPSTQTNVEQGNNITFTITPDAGYTVADVLVDDVSVGPVATYTFTNVTEVHTIEALFDVLAINLPLTVETTDTTATISFTTNYPATTTIQYGTTDSYGSSVTGSVNTTNHTITITGLTPSTTYHYEAIALDVFNTSVSTNDDTFTTTVAPPTPTPIRRGGGGGGSIVRPPETVPPVQTPTIPVAPQPAVLPTVSTLPSSAFTRNLTIGSRGSDVTALQNILIQRGYLAPGLATGYFGTLTQAALIKLQEVSNITPAQGFFGPITRTFLTGSTGVPSTPTTPAIPPSSAFTRNLTVGSRGSDVTALQNILIQRGYLAPGLATGYFGELTKAALVQYQVANNITPAQGFFGPVTRGRVSQ